MAYSTEELNTVLADVIANLEMVVQAVNAGEPVEEPASELALAATTMKELLETADEEKPPEEEKPDEEKDKKEKAEKSATSALLSKLEKVLKSTTDGNITALAESEKVVKGLADRVDVLESGLVGILKGFGVPEPIEKSQPAAQSPIDQGAFMQMLAEGVAKQQAQSTQPVGVSRMGQGAIGTKKSRHDNGARLREIVGKQA